MKRFCRHPRWLALAVFAAGILLDQLTKLLIASLMELGETIPLLEGVLHITYVRNPGAAFGMLAEDRWVFLLVSTVTILAIGIYLFVTKSKNPFFITALAMILSGGVGNMIDRLAFGEVVDFIDFRLINFAVFNGADSFVCVGAALLFLSILFEKKPEGASKENATEAGAVTAVEAENETMPAANASGEEESHDSEG